MEENPMREIRVEKVTLNMGCGNDADKLKRAEKLINTISGQKPLITLTKDRTSCGMCKRRPVGGNVTRSKESAGQCVRGALSAIEKELKEKQVKDGEFSFGIKEYIDLPNTNYDPDVGIMGMDVCVTLERRGFRIKKRSKESKIGKKHLITKDETIEWLKKNFEVNVVGE